MGKKVRFACCFCFSKPNLTLVALLSWVLTDGIEWGRGERSVSAFAFLFCPCTHLTFCLCEYLWPAGLVRRHVRRDHLLLQRGHLWTASFVLWRKHLQAAGLVLRREHLRPAGLLLWREHLRPASLILRRGQPPPPAQAHAGVRRCHPARAPAGVPPRPPVQLAQASRITALGSNLGEHFLILFSLSFSDSISVFCKCCGRQNKVMVVVVAVALVLQLKHLRSTCPVLRCLHLPPAGLVFRCDHLRPAGSRPRAPIYVK